jgi:hypothetical protein
MNPQQRFWLRALAPYTLKGGAADDHSRWRLTRMAVDLAW